MHSGLLVDGEILAESTTEWKEIYDDMLKQLEKITTQLFKNIEPTCNILIEQSSINPVSRKLVCLNNLY